jgi:hypothetical protein
MTQTTISFGSPIVNPFRQGSQNDRLLRLLQRGSITNVEIVHDHHILNSTGRISEVREALRPHLMDVHAERVPGTGTFIYSLKGGM